MVIYGTYKERILETMVSKKESLYIYIYIYKVLFFIFIFLEQMVSKRMVFGSFTYNKEWVAVDF